jgi:hypothetical protein
VLATIFAIVLFAIISQVFFILNSDQKTLISMPDMRLHRWPGFDRSVRFESLEDRADEKIGYTDTTVAFVRLLLHLDLWQIIQLAN